MPQVASDTKSYALHHSLQQNARQASSADRASSSFESLIDDSLPPAPERRAQPDKNDSPPRAERSQPAQDIQKTAKSEAKAAPDDTEAPATTEPAAEETKAAGSDKPVTDGNAGEKIDGDTFKVAGDDVKPADDGNSLDDSKPAGDEKPADGIAPPPDLTAIPPNGQPPAPPSASDAVAAAVTPTTTTDVVPTVEPTADESAVDAAAMQKAQPNVLAALQTKTDEAEKADKKATADKPSADLKAAAKAPAPFDPDAALQHAPAKSENDATAHARAVESANMRRGANPEAAGKEKPAANATSDNNNGAAPKAAADVVPTQVLTAPAHAQSATAAAAATPAVATQPAAASATAVPIEGIAVEISNKALAGKNQFEIRLDPPELGRIHVRLNVDRDGNVITHMVADRTDTLDLLRRDTAGLERALQDAGLKTSDNSLQFSLRDQSTNQQQNDDGAKTAHLVVEDEATVPNDVAARDYARYGARAGGLDIRV